MNVDVINIYHQFFYYQAVEIMRKSRLDVHSPFNGSIMFEVMGGGGGLKLMLATMKYMSN